MCSLSSCRHAAELNMQTVPSLNITYNRGEGYGIQLVLHESVSRPQIINTISATGLFQ